LKRFLRTYGFLFIVAGIVVGLDQWTKALVRRDLPLGQTWLPQSLEWLQPYARIVNWYNTGSAFGLFQGAWLVFTVLAFVVAGIIIYYYPQIERSDWSLRLAMGLQLGGALGNLVSRLTMSGSVTDFISVGNFPVFNVADSSISIGVAVLLLGLWFKDRQEQQPESSSPESSTSSLAEGSEAETVHGEG
jgi:signal peptidase II